MKELYITKKSYDENWSGGVQPGHDIFSPQGELVNTQMAVIGWFPDLLNLQVKEPIDIPPV